jgi:hypothetical protein
VSLAEILTGPGVRAAFGAAALQEPVVESPLPGGIADVVRFLLTTVPQWVQIAGVFLGLAVAAVAAWFAWRRRARIRHWVVTRRRPIQVLLAAAAIVALIGSVGFGAASWNYVQHDNGFCTGCHVMGPAYQRFVQSEHDSLSCHDCHQQPLMASMRQLYLWVAERPQDIGKHAKVPTPVCENCHVVGDAKKTWQRIASTAGHRTHLESDSSDLRDVQCVTCHGVEVHRFTPVDSTCAQAKCHVNVEIKLAKMREQTELHCATCHQFTADVPALATRDSASGTLVPGKKQCFSCHEMRAVLEEFDPARDAHSGTCGMCHNPHEQETPGEAAKTCTTAQCHGNWRNEPFHTGASHSRSAQSCTLCHQPHRAKVDAADCVGCHREVQGRRVGPRRLNPPLPFDTTKALRRISLRPTTHSFVAPFFSVDLAVADTFSHERHKELSCIACHTTSRRPTRLTFQPPRGCQICHHQAPARSECATCHQSAELAPAQPVEVRVSVKGHPSRAQPASFDHAKHESRACIECHTTPVSLEAEEKVSQCVSCHTDHHAADKPCASCHTGDSPERRRAHASPVEGHLACASCHAPTVVDRLVPDRPMCLTCHAPQREHYADRQCTVCHFQATPEKFRNRIVKRADS